MFNAYIGPKRKRCSGSRERTCAYLTRPLSWQMPACYSLDAAARPSSLHFQGMARNGLHRRSHPLGHTQPWVILKRVSFLRVLDDPVESYDGTHPTQTAVKGLRVRRSARSWYRAHVALLPIVYIAHPHDSEADRCQYLLAGPYKHVAGLVRVNPALLAPRPRFDDRGNLELPARLVFIAVVAAFLTGAPGSPAPGRTAPLSVAVLKVRTGEIAEPVLAFLRSVPHRRSRLSLCALEGPFLYDKLLFDVTALPASLDRSPLSGRAAPVRLGCRSAGCRPPRAGGWRAGTADRITRPAPVGVGLQVLLA